MGHLYLYTVFHANLNFSAIPEEQYSYIIDRCFWPVLELLREFPSVKLGFEFPASTLEMIEREDPSFIVSLRELWGQGRCEVIGSGYTQTILPLIPADANARNLALGNEVYERLLGRRPVTAYVNEQTYSSGILKLYKESGYSQIIADWENTIAHNPYPEEYRYSPQWAVAQDGTELPVVWNSSVSFQKFQRYAYGELSIEEYLAYIAGHYAPNEDRALLLYGNDWEVFDYKPGDADGLYFRRPESREMDRLRVLFQRLVDDERFQLVTPGELMKLLPPRHRVALESPEGPIVTKKQLRYNPTRWAVCGRDDVKINTQCSQLYRKLTLAAALMERAGGEDSDCRTTVDELWRDLTHLWGSDFRTSTTDEKHMSFRNAMGSALARADQVIARLSSRVSVKGAFALFNPSSNPWDGYPYVFTMRFKPGEVRDPFTVAVDGAEAPTQLESVEHYRDGSVRKAVLVVKPHLGPKSIGQCELVQRATRVETRGSVVARDDAVETPEVKVRFNPARGGTIREVTFPSVSSLHLAGTMPHGYFNSVKLSPDWYSGGVIAMQRFGERITDLVRTELLVPDDMEQYPIRIPVRCKIGTPIGPLWKTYYVYREEPRLDISYHFRLDDFRPLSFRLGIMTVNPEAFHRDSLRYATINGGESPEVFYLKGKLVEQDETVSVSVSAQGCLGATEGWVDIADDEKGVAVITQPSQMYSVPLLHYEETGDSFFLRLYSSIGECDETAESLWRGHNRMDVTFLGHGPGLDEVRAQAEAINGGLLVIQA